MTLRATLYMKPDCHLCEATLADLARLRGGHPHILELIDITADEKLVQQYGERIPVLKIAGREYDAPLVAAVLERALAEAAVLERALAEAASEHGRGRASELQHRPERGGAGPPKQA